MKTIIAGGRDYRLTPEDFLFLGRLTPPPDEVVSGACPTGADFDGERWAKAKNIPVTRFPADWKTHGPSAGPKRNKQMAEYARGGRLVAFPGGRGTASMIREAKAAGLEIIVAPWSAPL